MMKTVIEMARDAGPHDWPIEPDFLERFAAIVREDEREKQQELLEALQGLLDDIVEYQTINKLGGENNHWQVIARAVIAKFKEKQL